MDVIGAVLEHEKVEEGILTCSVVLTFSNYKKARIFCRADKKGERLKAIDITPMEGACPKCQSVAFSSFSCGCNFPAKKGDFLQKARPFLRKDFMRLIVTEGFAF